MRPSIGLCRKGPRWSEPNPIAEGIAHPDEPGKHISGPGSPLWSPRECLSPRPRDTKDDVTALTSRPSQAPHRAQEQVGYDR